jgi:hypothetical protein
LINPKKGQQTNNHAVFQAASVENKTIKSLELRNSVTLVSNIGKVGGLPSN